MSKEKVQSIKITEPCVVTHKHVAAGTILKVGPDVSERDARLLVNINRASIVPPAGTTSDEGGGNSKGGDDGDGEGGGFPYSSSKLQRLNKDEVAEIALSIDSQIDVTVTKADLIAFILEKQPNE